MLDKGKHLLVLKQLLREIYTDSELSAQLVFKGGSALMLFYGLDRFSTDLDFDLRSTVADIDLDNLSRIASKQLSIKDAATKKNTYLIEGSYETGMQQVKIEVSKRVFPQDLVLHSFLGLTIPVLSEGHLLAHKLCAVTSRRMVLGRDIYDADFMLRKNWQPNAEIIKLRTGLNPVEYYEQLYQTIDDPAVNQSIILGLGEVLDDEARAWARASLAKSFKQQLQLRM